MASRVAFSCFRAVTAFGDLPLGQKCLRIALFPYFLAKAALSKSQPVGARPSHAAQPRARTRPHCAARGDGGVWAR